MDRIKAKKHEKGTRIPTSETTKHAKKREKRDETGNGRESTHHRTARQNNEHPETQRNASQTDSGRFMVFDIFSADVFDNQPIWQQTHRFSRIFQVTGREPRRHAFGRPLHAVSQPCPLCILCFLWLIFRLSFFELRLVFSEFCILSCLSCVSMFDVVCSHSAKFSNCN